MKTQIIVLKKINSVGSNENLITCVNWRIVECVSVWEKRESKRKEPQQKKA